MKPARILLVKTASEISLKSDYVERQFTSVLIDGIKTAAKNNGLKIAKIERSRGRLFVYSDSLDELSPILQDVFGIHAIAAAETAEFSDLNELSNFATDFSKSVLGAKDSFAVRVARSGKHSFSSKDAEVKIGSEILEKLAGLNLKVDLTRPKKTIYVEARDGKAYCYSKETHCLGGLPLGVEGNVGAVFSGSGEDAVAAFLMMKRGCKAFPIIESNENKCGLLLGKLKKFNLYNDFKSIKISEIDSMKSKCKLQAIAISERQLKTKETEMFGLPILRPVTLYPEELYEKIRKHF